MIVALLLLSLDLSPVLNRDVVAGERICSGPAIRTFYERREGRPAWNERTIAVLVGAIDRLSAEGLPPHRYHREVLERLAMNAEREVLATDAFLTAATQLSSGVVDPQFVRPAWCGPPPRFDVAAVLEAALEADTIEESLVHMAPRHPGYRRLRDALALYRAIAARGGWEPLAEGNPLRVGARDVQVSALRRRLAVELGMDPSPAADDALFDRELHARVSHFQEHHGIRVDGIVGPETLRELNVSPEARVREIAVNLERWRWMPEDLGQSHAIVNIAAFRLNVIEGERTVLTMKTVVGKDYNRTPFFAARITNVVVNPWWNVPDRIAAKELWPKQHLDPGYLEQEHMIVTAGRIRQRPGPWNALGRLKFNMPNGYDVYLHDTPAKSLFAEPFRAFSHGCIRLERPMDLAVYLLRDQPQWTREAIERTIEKEVERSIALKTPHNVYVLYWTAWVGDDGHVEFHQDHYDRDASIAAALE